MDPKARKGESGPGGHVLHVAAEMSPYVSTGGLGEVLGSLPRALAARDWRSTVLLPLYGTLEGLAPPARRTWSGTVDVLRRTYPVDVWEGPAVQGAHLLLLDCPALFARQGVYGDAAGLFADNDVRYAVLSKVAVRLARELDPPVDVLHAHDWHAAPAVVWARELDPPLATVLTIHNHAYRGEFGPQRLAALELGDVEASVGSFLERGILDADEVTTVSPAYAQEIAAASGVFARRGDAPWGILNGLDLREWDPRSDRRIASCFDVDTLPARAKNRDALREELGLASTDDVVAAFQGRFTHQKGLDILLDAAPRLLDRNLQVVFHGDGDPRLEEGVRRLAREHPQRVGAVIGFDRDFSARLFAGTDVLLMPSRFEPCGLTQLQAMRYGAIPIVHATGGLKDTVHPLAERGRRSGASNGFWLKTLTPRALSLAVGKALRYLARPDAWRTLQRNAMTQDVSWDASAVTYGRVYGQARQKAAHRARKAPIAPVAAVAKEVVEDVEEIVEKVVEPRPGYALEGPPLPEGYSQDALHVTAQSPRLLYAYWEVPGATSLRLWLADAQRRREVAVVRARGEAWIPVEPERIYHVVLEDGSGEPRLRSNLACTPADRPLESIVDVTALSTEPEGEPPPTRAPWGELSPRDLPPPSPGPVTRGGPRRSLRLGYPLRDEDS